MLDFGAQYNVPRLDLSLSHIDAIEVIEATEKDEKEVQTEFFETIQEMSLLSPL